MVVFRSSVAQKKPRLPEGVRIYAIGDIHGRSDLLESVLDRIDDDLKKNPAPVAIEVYLGDYVDRGPASREVIDRLLARSRTFRTVFLKGNHETYLADFATNPGLLKDWEQLGGLQTIMSYGVSPSLRLDTHAQMELAKAFDRALPKSHRQFLDELKMSFTCGDFFFVHAGIRPGIPLAKQREEDLLWIREDFLLCEDKFSKIVVHGHTPVREPDIRSNRINIDTGAYATGRLTCLRLERNDIDFI